MTNQRERERQHSSDGGVRLACRLKLPQRVAISAHAFPGDLGVRGGPTRAFHNVDNALDVPSAVLVPAPRRRAKEFKRGDDLPGAGHRDRRNGTTALAASGVVA
jgi:hypothetical protein